MLWSNEGVDMSVAGPTIITIILLVGLVFVAAVLIGRTTGPPSRRPERGCRAADCGTVNPPNARFCGRCGQKLD